MIYANNSTNGGGNNANWVFNAAGQLHHFAISAISTPQTAGVPFSITITAQDVSNATVAGFTGTVTITDRSGTIVPAVSASFVAGVDTETVNISAPTTNDTIVVSNGTIQGQSAAFTVQAYSGSTGLVGWWKFDDGAGTTAVDSSASAANGTLVNGPAWTVGRIGGALSFNGTNSYVSVVNQAPYNITAAITVAAWVKVTSFTTAWQAVVTKGDSAWRLVRNNTTNGLCFAIDGGPNTVFGTRNVNDGNWHHAAGVFDGTTLYLYIDGTLDATFTATTGTISTDALQCLHR